MGMNGCVCVKRISDVFLTLPCIQTNLGPGFAMPVQDSRKTRDTQIPGKRFCDQLNLIIPPLSIAFYAEGNRYDDIRAHIFPHASLGKPTCHDIGELLIRAIFEMQDDGRERRAILGERMKAERNGKFFACPAWPPRAHREPAKYTSAIPDGLQARVAMIAPHFSWRCASHALDRE
jgi:hypothetical protein